MKRRQILGVGAAATCSLAAGRLHAQAAVNDHEVVLGQTGILSGPLGAVVREFNAGAQIAFSQANAHGGVNGRQVRMVTLDDELKPEMAVANYWRLLAEHQAVAFFGCVGSSTTAAAADLLQNSGVASVGGYAVADSAREKIKGQAFFVRASSGREAQKVMQQIKIHGQWRVAAAGLDNAGGREVVQLIQNAAAAEGMTFVGSALVKPDGSNAVEQGRVLAAAQPQAVLMFLSGALPGGFIGGMRKTGSTAVFYGMSIVQGRALAQALGAGVRGIAIAQVMPYPWAKTNPDAVNFSRLATRANAEVNYTTFEGYLNARVMLEALVRAGRNLTQGRLLATLRTLRMHVAGMQIDFSNPLSLAGSQFVELVLLGENGRFVR
jgi:branched-chain amino acid transport system substrate-binding protein